MKVTSPSPSSPGLGAEEDALGEVRGEGRRRLGAIAGDRSTRCLDPDRRRPPSNVSLSQCRVSKAHFCCRFRQMAARKREREREAACRERRRRRRGVQKCDVEEQPLGLSFFPFGWRWGCFLSCSLPRSLLLFSLFCRLLSPLPPPPPLSRFGPRRTVPERPIPPFPGNGGPRFALSCSLQKAVAAAPWMILYWNSCMSTGLQNICFLRR